MRITLNLLLFSLLLLGFYCILEWMWNVGVREIVIYTEHFLLEEADRLRVAVLPDVKSAKWWDRLELLLYYSGIRGYLPFVSAKVWLIGQGIWAGCTFVLVTLLSGSIWTGLGFTLATGVLWGQLLGILRRSNLRSTERCLLEFINVAESFAVTGEEPVAILMCCGQYLTGPVGRALASIEKHRRAGWTGRMILEQLKVTLEHPKWQEFIHNLNICSMYNSDFGFVFRASRKSIQGYLSSKKERQSIKHTAQLEMGMIIVLSLVIVLVLGKFLNMQPESLLWGNPFARGCTIYMTGIVVLFFWKINTYEKE